MSNSNADIVARFISNVDEWKKCYWQDRLYGTHDLPETKRMMDRVRFPKDVEKAENFLNELKSDGHAVAVLAVKLELDPRPLLAFLTHTRYKTSEGAQDARLIAECVRTALKASADAPRQNGEEGKKETQEVFFAPQSQAPIAIYYHGGRSYSADGRSPANLSKEQHNFLQAFLNKEAALETKELEKEGVNNVSKVAARINLRFPGSVKTPDRKGAGYYVRVHSLTPTG